MSKKTKVIDLLSNIPESMIASIGDMKRYACGDCSCYLEKDENECPFCNAELDWSEIK